MFSILFVCLEFQQLPEPLRASLTGLLSNALVHGPEARPSTFSPVSTPAQSILDLSYFVLAITGGIFITVGGTLLYVILRYRQKHDDRVEPAQIYGSTQVEIAWTVIPVLTVIVLFLTTARVIFATQDAPEPNTAVEVTVTGHQFWWEFNYPKLGIHTANEMHVPVSNPKLSRPTFMTLLSADVIHSFWVPTLSGKMDLVPNSVNHMWIDPHVTGIYVGQCAQFCGVQHAKMLLRVYVDTPEAFAAWVKNQQHQAAQDQTVAAGRQIFETQACMNCHTVDGTAATGHFGPDLTHLMSRDTLASGAMENTRANLREWIRNPDTFKQGSLMPAMQLDDQQLDQVTAYLSTLR
jgi:cytochrome c oxidase subunit II